MSTTTTTPAPAPCRDCGVRVGAGGDPWGHQPGCAVVGAWLRAAAPAAPAAVQPPLDADMTIWVAPPRTCRVCKATERLVKNRPQWHSEECRYYRDPARQ